jgi:hypothetical protein
MRAFCDSLCERDRRRYAAVEALKHGPAGVAYVSELLGVDAKTVARGRRELHDPEALAQTRIRQAGGGRKRIVEMRPEIHDAFLDTLREHTAGSPMDERIKWTNLTRREIAETLIPRGHKVSVTVVDQLLKRHNFRRRKARKRLAGGRTSNRDEQFRNIARLVKEYHDAGNPVMSMDTKKKEHLGTLYRDGKLYTREEIEVYDHDFPSLAEGKVIPHCLYDIFDNVGYISIGISHDTSEFACDSVRHWWREHGRERYAEATGILFLCDSGGSNDARFYCFKEELQKLAKELGLPIRIAHYPPYTSKYNPIEHRFFPHVTRACQGVILTSVELVRELMARTKTKKGLRAFATIIDKTYETGRKASKQFREAMPICFDDYLPKWNYQAIPTRQIRLVLRKLLNACS